MENLQDKLLEHVVPDQVGQVGKIQYRFTEMRIVHVHWPKVTNSGALFIANNGALRLHGKYHIQRPGVLGYNKTGEFIFDLGAICLTIKDNSIEPTPSPPRHRHHHHHTHHHRHRPLPHDVTCTVGLIKVKFQGGAARVCQFLTSLYIKVYRRHLEAQIAKVIQETVQDDGQILLSALTVMASMHSENEEEPEHTERHRTHTETNSRHTIVQRTASVSSEPEVGKMQRFLDSFTRHRPDT
ncbi:uncharacterized protein LOC123563885 [Mercenaria mercenaria]|uniref:uncharacterized protein LOC123563885 n=1 Tax=Mercenaria mercenaria TaxID=6596 RepID=UPI00234E9EBB|nr:uncharacterized protein LOC123563885 [Mercenaria mercenaria]XP_053392483.1 uncharacterized protein LOC123563885 [Mercenaria mercenaria]